MKLQLGIPQLATPLVVIACVTVAIALGAHVWIAHGEAKRLEQLRDAISEHRDVDIETTTLFKEELRSLKASLADLRTEMSQLKSKVAYLQSLSLEAPSGQAAVDPPPTEPTNVASGSSRQPFDGRLLPPSLYAYDDLPEDVPSRGALRRDLIFTYSSTGAALILQMSGPDGPVPQTFEVATLAASALELHRQQIEVIIQDADDGVRSGLYPASHDASDLPNDCERIRLIDGRYAGVPRTRVQRISTEQQAANQPYWDEIMASAAAMQITNVGVSGGYRW